MSEKEKQNEWPESYERLLNVELELDPEHLSNQPPQERPSYPNHYEGYL